MGRKMDEQTVAKKTIRSRKPTSGRQAGSRAVVPAARSVENSSILPCTDAQIRERAYFIYLDRKGAPGDPMADWLQAERELTQASFALRG